MAIDFDLACRRDELGPLLAALMIAEAGGRVLLLPPLKPALVPDFLIPVLRGLPARLLLDRNLAGAPPADFFSWRDGKETGGVTELAERGEDRIRQWALLEEISQVLDAQMVAGLEMPASGIGGFWRILKLLVGSEVLRENRRLVLDSWLNEASERELLFWSGLLPLISLARYNDCPLPAFAYGIQTLLKAEAWAPPSLLRPLVYRRLLEAGAVVEDDKEQRPVFDGKWFIGVGRQGPAKFRVRVFLADSSPAALFNEVPPAVRRHDLEKELRMKDHGFVRVVQGDDGYSNPAADELYQCLADSREKFSGVQAHMYRLPGGLQETTYCWRPATENADDAWGWTPFLPPMMGGGFLPQSGGFCRFYRIGWHNLPGFGLGGLVYTAWQAARRIALKEMGWSADRVK